jgi:hypothetical protein
MQNRESQFQMPINLSVRYTKYHFKQSSLLFKATIEFLILDSKAEEKKLDAVR